ncbi:MAG: hypothetical protein ACREXG_13565, partial [Polaromonas sp.]
MGQEDGEKWTAAADLQPTHPESDRLLNHAEDALPALIAQTLGITAAGIQTIHVHKRSFDARKA